jgi:hypothetical protein
LMMIQNQLESVHNVVQYVPSNQSNQPCAYEQRNKTRGLPGVLFRCYESNRARIEPKWTVSKNPSDLASSSSRRPFRGFIKETVGKQWEGGGCCCLAVDRGCQWPNFVNLSGYVALLGPMKRFPQKGSRDYCYISIYQPPPPTTNTAQHPATAIRPWVRLPFRSNTAGRPAILSRRVITAMSRPASASPAVLVARRPAGRPWHKTGHQGGWQE